MLRVMTTRINDTMYGDDVGDHNDDGGGDDCDGNGAEGWYVSDRPDDDGDE